MKRISNWYLSIYDDKKYLVSRWERSVTLEHFIISYHSDMKIMSYSITYAKRNIELLKKMEYYAYPSDNRIIQHFHEKIIQHYP